MDISYIEDLPPGRQRVATALVSDTPSEIAQVWPSGRYGDDCDSCSSRAVLLNVECFTLYWTGFGLTKAADMGMAEIFAERTKFCWTWR